MLDLATSKLEGSLEQRQHGAWLWAKLIEHGLARPLDAATVHEIGGLVRTGLQEMPRDMAKPIPGKRDLGTEHRRQLVLRGVDLLGWSSPNEATDQAMDLLESIATARDDDPDIRTRSVEAMIRLARAQGSVSRWAQPIATIATRPGSSAGTFRHTVRLVEDLVDARHMGAARDLVAILIRKIDEDPPGGNAGIRTVVNSLRGPLTYFMRLALATDRDAILDIAPKVRTKLGAGLVGAAWGGARDDTRPRLESMLSSPMTSDELKVKIREQFQGSDVPVRWPELWQAMARGPEMR